MKLIIFCVLFVLSGGVELGRTQLYDETTAANYLNNLYTQLSRLTNLQQEANWAYEINLTEENENKINRAANDLAKLFKEISTEIQNYDWQKFKSKDLRRQFEAFTRLGYAQLSEEDYAEYLSINFKMLSNYAAVRFCDYRNRTECDLPLEPDVENIFSTSQDPDELQYYWREFYNQFGPNVRRTFERYIELNTKAAQLNNFTSGAEMWLAEYEDPTFEKQLDEIFVKLHPLYTEIHGYVRYRLQKFYGEQIVSTNEPIPMHLLGDMWGQQWSHIVDIVSPFPDKQLFDVTDEMLRQNYTPMRMFQMGDDFFKSMNFSELPESFWTKSVFEKPSDDRRMLCQPSASDFYVKDDVRMKQCTRVNQEHFFIVHHELGHLEYFLQYQHLPYVYRSGANPGFQEAVGDVISLSVSTPKHLQRIGLLKDYRFDEQTRINHLFRTALEKIVFLPFAFSLEKYRWALFRGEIDKKDWNCAFWNLKEQYSGIQAAIQRNENDFDPPAKYHVSADIEFLRYLVANIIQFQFYKSACLKAGQYEPGNRELPLDNCDIYGSVEAGNAFKKMLSMGSSRPWQDAMEAFTGERTMNADAISEYFEPLRIWLEAENKEKGVHIGWTSSNQCAKEGRR